MVDPDGMPLRNVYLGRSLQRLLVLIAGQGQETLRASGVDYSMRSAPIVLLLAKGGPMAAADLAKALGEPHQLVAQRLDALLDLDIVTRDSDAADARRKVLKITPKGRAQLRRLKACFDLLEAAYERLFAEIGCDLAGKVLEITEALTREPLPERVLSERAAAQDPTSSQES